MLVKYEKCVWLRADNVQRPIEFIFSATAAVEYIWWFWSYLDRLYDEIV